MRRAMRATGWLAAGCLAGSLQALAVAELEPGGEATPAPDALEEPSLEEGPVSDDASEEAPVSDDAVEPAATGGVARAVFTSAVVDREPSDELETLTTDATRVSYFSELHGLAGHTVTHRWEHDGEVRAEISFVVRGPRWRVHSSKTLDPAWTGVWRVSVVDGDGRVLRTDRLDYRETDSGRSGSEAAGSESNAID